MLQPRTTPRTAQCVSARAHAAGVRPVRPAPAGPTPAELAAANRDVPRVKGLPWIGSTHIPLDKVFTAMQAEFRASGAPALRMGLWGTEPAVYFREPDHVALIGGAGHRFGKIVKGLDKGFQRFSGPRSLFVLQNDGDHAAMRSVLAPFFGMASLKNLVPIFVEVANEMVDVALQSEAGGRVDLESITRRAMLDVIGRTAFGYDFQALRLLGNYLAGADSLAPGALQQRTRPLAFAYARAADVGAPPIDVVDILEGTYFMAMLQTFDLPVPDVVLPGYAKYIRGIEQLEACVEQVLDTYRDRAPSGDAAAATTTTLTKKPPSLLGCMVTARDAGQAGVDDGTIRDNLLTFMIAGSDTVATTLAMALFELAHHPAAQARLVQELSDAGLLDADIAATPPPPDLVVGGLPFLSAVIKETLRLYPAAPSTGRLVKGDDVVGGYFIPAGTQVVMDFYNMHRHERYWPRPDDWLPERWMPDGAPDLGPSRPDAYEPFGVGARACIGRVFANLELHYVLAHVVRRLALAPVAGSGPHIQLHKSFTLRSETPLVVSFGERARVGMS